MRLAALILTNIAGLLVLTAARCDFRIIQIGSDSDGHLVIPRNNELFLLDPETTKLQPIPLQTKGPALAAQFSPEGQRLLVVSGVSLVEEATLHIVDRDGTIQQSLGRTSKAPAYMTWSPDAEWVAWSMVFDNGISLRLARTREIEPRNNPYFGGPSSMSPLHCWYADSKSLLVMEISQEKRPDSDQHYARLIRFSIDTQARQTIARAIIDRTKPFFDLDEESGFVLVRAAWVGPPGEEPQNTYPTSSLFRVDTRNGKADLLIDGGLTVTDLAGQADPELPAIFGGIDFALWSPNGDKMLFESSGKLYTADEQARQRRRVASDVVLYIDDDWVYLPTWLDNDRIAYLVPGERAHRYDLRMVRTDGTGRKSLQRAMNLAGR